MASGSECPIADRAIGPKPVDALARIRVAQASADFTIFFDNGAALQIVNLSSGYEAWMLTSEGDFMMGEAKWVLLILQPEIRLELNYDF